MEIMDGLRVPSVVVAHTVLKDPTPHQRSVLEAVVEKADQVVVMSEAGRDRLCAGYSVDPAKVATIPHGAAVPAADVKRPSRPVILTWGLLGPGKGIERVIDAMASLKSLPGRPQYLIAGRTHPKVLAAEGEAYREARMEQARRLGVANSVTFDPVYRTTEEVTALVQTAAVVVLPYDSVDQVASGVLVESIASGRPIVATAFPHAVEMLAQRRGHRRRPRRSRRAGRRPTPAADRPATSPTPWPRKPASWPRRSPGPSSPPPTSRWRNGCSPPAWH